MELQELRSLNLLYQQKSSNKHLQLKQQIVTQRKYKVKVNAQVQVQEQTRTQIPFEKQKQFKEALYRDAAQYLFQELGLNNRAEIAQILDVAMNPNSMFFKKQKYTMNKHARPLKVDQDIQPIVNYLLSLKLEKQEVVRILNAYPQVLCLNIQKLQDWGRYLQELGVENVGKMIITRPSLLALDVDENLKKIVFWLQTNENRSIDDIVRLLQTSI